MKLLFWCFTNFDKKLSRKNEWKIPDFAVLTTSWHFPVRSRSTTPILDEAELYEESFEV